ncbi:hypothetical protein [Spiroplasma endosymbiont of Amphimallon solstitiale]|uniref:hypothetical protein n=1 Tax=Spiroplasma endosymbiont of Amphimallon solstitiale TaxID=3066288 RepID=UPI00313EE7CA
MDNFYAYIPLILKYIIILHYFRKDSKQVLRYKFISSNRKKDDASAFFIKEYNSKLDIDIVKKEINSEKKEILELINNNFDKIITTNYDNIFGWNELEKPKQYIKNWINNIEELNDKVYPIHGWSIPKVIC